MARGNKRLKVKNVLFMTLIPAAVVALGLYAFGMLNINGGVRSADGSIRVANMRNEAGEFDYSGPVKNRSLSGEGTIVFDNGFMYSGGFLDDRFSGEGTFYADDGPAGGWTYTGEFLEGRPVSGIFRFADGIEVIYSSTPSYATLAGAGWTYAGRLRPGGQSGWGIFTFDDGCAYTGYFLDGLPDGEGDYTGSDGGIIYFGSFKNGFFDGRGTYRNPEGWVYEGGFKEGLFDGNGSVTTDGVTVNGVWRGGEQVIRYD